MAAFMAVVGWYILIGAIGVVAGFIGGWYVFKKRKID